MCKLIRIFYGHLVENSSEVINAEHCVEEAKKLAIDFAKEILRTKIKCYKSGRIGEESNFDVINTPELDLIFGELELNGDKLLDEFIENKYITNG